MPFAVLTVSGGTMKEGCRVTVYIEGQRDPITGTVERDEPLMLHLRELDEPIEKSTIVTCTEISGDDPVADDESEPSSVVRPFGVRESEGVEPVIMENENSGGGILRKILILVSVMLLVFLVCFIVLRK